MSEGPKRRSRGARRERGSISAGEIIAGALTLAEADGIDALSLPRLAKSLGIGVTSIYWYFENKSALIEAMSEEAARRLHELIIPTSGGTWQAHVEELYLRLHAALRDNRLLCDLLYMRGSRLNESALVQLWPEAEQSLAKMVAAGFTPHDGLQGLVALSLYTRGSVVLERQMQLAGVEPTMPTPVTEDFPLLFEAARTQSFRGVTEDAFATQLRMLIEGMAARLSVSRKAQ
jgi:AcrR family transcriptional regulator